MNEKREWINTGTQIFILIIMIIGIFQIINIKIDLSEISSKNIATNEIIILTPDGQIGGYIYSNGTNLIIKNANTNESIYASFTKIKK